MVFSLMNFVKNGLFLLISWFISGNTWAYLRVFWGHHKKYPLFCLFQSVRLTWNICQYIYWSIIQFKPLEYPYETSAQVLDVVWTMKLMPVDTARMTYYVLKHSYMTHPTYVLNDNCFIARVWKHKTAFVDFGKPVQDHFTVKHTPFLWDEAVSHAKRLIIMPTCSLSKLALQIPFEDRIDNRGSDLTMLFNTGRCGSTLVTRIIDTADANCMVLSEPNYIYDLSGHISEIPYPVLDQLTLDATRLLCKPLQKNPEKRKIFVKVLCLALPSARLFQKLIPQVRLFFLHRDPLKSAWAHERAFGQIIAYRGGQWYQWCFRSHWFHYIYGVYRGNGRVDEASYKCMPMTNIMEYCLQLWATLYMSWVEQAQEFNFPQIVYDDVFQDADRFVRKILHLSGYDEGQIESLLPKAMQALHFDSQSGRGVGQKHLHGFPVTKITPKIQARILSFCKELNLPEPSSFVTQYTKQEPPPNLNVYQSLLRSVHNGSGTCSS